MQQFQLRTSHRPRPLPSGRWALTQRWNDLLFAHWPIPIAKMAALLPDWLEVDTFQVQVTAAVEDEHRMDLAPVIERLAAGDHLGDRHGTLLIVVGGNEAVGERHQQVLAFHLPGLRRNERGCQRQQHGSQGKGMVAARD